MQTVYRISMMFYNCIIEVVQTKKNPFYGWYLFFKSTTIPIGSVIRIVGIKSHLAPTKNR